MYHDLSLSMPLRLLEIQAEARSTTLSQTGGPVRMQVSAL